MISKMGKIPEPAQPQLQPPEPTTRRRLLLRYYALCYITILLAFVTLVILYSCGYIHSDRGPKVVFVPVGKPVPNINVVKWEIVIADKSGADGEETKEETVHAPGKTEMCGGLEKPVAPGVPMNETMQRDPEPAADPIDWSLMTTGEDKDPLVREKRNKIKEMMKHAWDGYKHRAWGKNEIRPMTFRSFLYSMFAKKETGQTIVDGLDTLYLMGLTDEFTEGRNWIAQNFTLDNMNVDLSVSDTTSRYVAGLLSCYALTGDSMFRDKAAMVADKLMSAFYTPTGIPKSQVNTKTGVKKNHWWVVEDGSMVSEFGNLHLEFTYLSDVMGYGVYADLMKKIRHVLKGLEKSKGLYHNYVDPLTGQWSKGRDVSFASLGNQFYNNLLKAWIQSNYKDTEARQMYDEAVKGILETMVTKSPDGLTYISELALFDELQYKMYQSSCIAGGMFGLGGATMPNTADRTKYIDLGANITHTCHESYVRSPTHLGPERLRFEKDNRTITADPDFFTPGTHAFALRPSTIESYFVMWRLTGDNKYRDWAWDAVLAIEKHCRTTMGYCGLMNVNVISPIKNGVQPSWFLGGTLKYLYLMFSDASFMSLDEWVFNANGHPLPIKDVNPLYREKAIPKHID